MPEHNSPCNGLARVEVEVENLKRSQETQDGVMEKLNGKIDANLAGMVQAQRAQFYALAVAIVMLAANIALSWK